MSNDERKKIYEEVLQDFNISLNEDGSQNNDASYWMMWADTWKKYAKKYNNDIQDLLSKVNKLNGALDKMSNELKQNESKQHEVLDFGDNFAEANNNVVKNSQQHVATRKIESKEQFAKKMMHVVIHNIVMQNETEYTPESFAEYAKLFKDNPKYQQIFFNMLYETLTEGTTVYSDKGWN